MIKGAGNERAGDSSVAHASRESRESQESARWPDLAASTFAVILAGGGGTRLWPASRRHRPKQLLHLGGGESLLAAAVRRAEALLGPGRTLIVTAADQAAPIRQELPGLPPEDIIVEPEPRNTAGAVGLAAAAAMRRSGPDTILAILPADPHIGDEDAFAGAVRAAIGHASTGIVTVGLRPTYPESGFGYIRLGAGISAGDAAATVDVFAVDRFVEKPTWELARDYVASGEYLWNSGMFFLTAERLLREARRQMPEMGAALDAIIAAPDFTAGINAHYRRVPIISIDHGIMEGAPEMRVVRADFGWNDVGSWAALSSIRPHDVHGNVVLGDGIVVHDCAGSVVVSEPGAPYVGVVGVNDMVVVATADAILVVHKDRAQDVRKVVESVKAAGRKDLL